MVRDKRRQAAVVWRRGAGSLLAAVAPKARLSWQEHSESEKESPLSARRSGVTGANLRSPAAVGPCCVVRWGARFARQGRMLVLSEPLLRLPAAWSQQADRL